MSLSHLWPIFPLERILYEDEDVIVIDKPVNVSTHAPDPGRNDDAVSRLRRALSERDRVPVEKVYLGIHQRLDRDTSGALLFTKQKSANGGVASQFEQRLVKKTYVAAVVGWSSRQAQGVLTHVVAPAEEGRMRVVSHKERVKGGQTAVTRYRVVRRVDDRALLELSPETGRTHQIRVQIAATGAKLAGDRMYGGDRAERLMLHAARLELAHPASGERLEVHAPVPARLERWLDDPKARAIESTNLLETCLSEAVAARWALGTSTDTTAFRVVHGAGDGIEGIAVDVYGEYVLIHFFSPEAIARQDEIVDQVYALGVRGVYVMIHPKQSNTLVDPKRESLSPPLPVRGEAAPDPLVVLESGLAYRARLGDGLKTGIFLDQRENRRRVRELAHGKRVLNLFAYTCGFTVAAAAGGAESTVSVDVSKGTLAWGFENLEQNGLGGPAHTFVDVDVFDWLKLANKRRERYDLIVLDPPSYATTKTSRFSASDDYPDLAARALGVLAPGGRMLACTNHQGIAVRKFRRQLHEAGRVAARAIVQVKDLPAPIDYPPPLGADPDLKSALVTAE